MVISTIIHHNFQMKIDSMKIQCTELSNAQTSHVCFLGKLTQRLNYWNQNVDCVAEPNQSEKYILFMNVNWKLGQMRYCFFCRFFNRKKGVKTNKFYGKFRDIYECYMNLFVILYSLILTMPCIFYVYCSSLSISPPLSPPPFRLPYTLCSDFVKYAV